MTIIHVSKSDLSKSDNQFSIYTKIYFYPPPYMRKGWNKSPTMPRSKELRQISIKIIIKGTSITKMLAWLMFLDITRIYSLGP